jgi:hypothetical protein
VGNNGGILSIWCSSKGQAVFSFSGLGFVGVCLEWGTSRKHCFVVNVYSKCSLVDKREMWEKLLVLKASLVGEAWCVAGDFNCVLHESERRGMKLRKTQEGGWLNCVRHFFVFSKTQNT